MKYLAAPKHDDLSTLKAIATSKRVKSFPLLSAIREQVEARYRSYTLSQGNAWRIRAPLHISENLKQALLTHYKTMPVDLGVIKHIRHKLSPDVCPMCGSLKVGEVDHVAPKDTYPEYSFFTKNLVPACDCNGLKKLSFKGPLHGQRVLHPYFDKKLEKRLAFVSFSGDFDDPAVELTVHPDFVKDLAVNYHIDSILRKTSVLDWIGKKWAAIRRTPESVFPLIRNLPGMVSDADVRSAVETQLLSKDEECGTPNNWYSMLYSGVLFSNGAIPYVVYRVNGLRSKTLFPD